VRLFVDDLTIAHECAGDALHARQRALARSLAEQHGVVCHVAQEISQAGPHKNAWGAAVPLLDYAGQAAGFTHDDGVAWAQRHGAVFSLNHPFSRYNRVEMDDAGRERALADVVETYVRTGASGAHTLEVGFPAGRHGFSLEDYLRMWDALSRAGVIITGSGSSDAHSARVGWQTGNNFATYIRAETADEAALIAGLRSGDVYMADPVLFRSRLRFRDRAGHRMGQVVALEPPAPAAPGGDRPGGEARSPAGDSGSAAMEVELTLDRAQPGWRLRWVVDGERQPAILLSAGQVTYTRRVTVDRPTFVRAEIWDSHRAPSGALAEGAETAPGAASGEVDGPQPAGRCIALTNPIWYVPGALPASVSSERLGGTVGGAASTA
jgi:hypothetical protein